MGNNNRITILWILLIFAIAVTASAKRSRRVKHQVIYQDESLNRNSNKTTTREESLRNLFRNANVPTLHLASQPAYPGDVSTFLKLSREATQHDLVKAGHQNNAKQESVTKYSGLPRVILEIGKSGIKSNDRKGASRYYPLSSYDDLVSPQQSASSLTTPSGSSSWLVPSRSRRSTSTFSSKKRNMYVLPGFAPPGDLLQRRSDITAELTADGAGFMLTESNPIESLKDSPTSSSDPGEDIYSAISDVIFKNYDFPEDTLSSHESMLESGHHTSTTTKVPELSTLDITHRTNRTDLNQNLTVAVSQNQSETASTHNLGDNVLAQLPSYHPPTKLPPSRPTSQSSYKPVTPSQPVTTVHHYQLPTYKYSTTSYNFPQQPFRRKPLFGAFNPPPPPRNAPLAPPLPPGQYHQNIPPSNPSTKLITTQVTAHVYTPSSSNGIPQASFQLPVYNMPPINFQSIITPKRHLRPTRSVAPLEMDSSEDKYPDASTETHNGTRRIGDISHEETRLFPISGHFEDGEFPFFTINEGPRFHPSRRFSHGPRFRSMSRGDRGGPIYHASEARRHSHGMLGSGNFEIIKGGIYPEDESNNNHAHYMQSGPAGVYDSNPGVYFDEGLFGNNPVLGFQGFSNFGSLYNSLSTEKRVSTVAPMHQDNAGRSASQLIPLTVELQAVP